MSHPFPLDNSQAQPHAHGSLYSSGLDLLGGVNGQSSGGPHPPDLSDLGPSSDGMSSVALMSMLHDGSLDMNALFHSDTAVFTASVGVGDNGPHRDPPSLNGFDNVFAPGNNGPNAMMGLVSTP